MRHKKIKIKGKIFKRKLSLILDNYHYWDTECRLVTCDLYKDSNGQLYMDNRKVSPKTVLSKTFINWKDGLESDSIKVYERTRKGRRVTKI